MKIRTHTVTMSLREMLAIYLESEDYAFLCPMVGKKLLRQEDLQWSRIDVLRANVLEVFCREFPDVCQISGYDVHIDPDVQKERLEVMFLENILIERPVIPDDAYDRTYRIDRGVRIATLNKLIDIHGGNYTMNFLVKIWRTE